MLEARAASKPPMANADQGAKLVGTQQAVVMALTAVRKVSRFFSKVRF